MSSVKSRREQYSDATREALLDSATQLFAEHGFTATALENVATATQVTRGAVYHHFSSKSHLFEAVLDRLEQGAIEHVGATAQAAETPWDAAQAALNAFLEYCCDPVYGRLVFQEGPIALGWLRWKECEERYSYGFIENLLRAGVESGQIEAMPLETTTRLVFALIGAAGLALADADAGDKPRVLEESRTMLLRLLRGLRPR